MSILGKFNSIFKTDTSVGNKVQSNNITAEKLAAAALMVEVAVQDGQFDKTEKRIIKKSLVEKLDLSENEAEELLKEAVERQEQSIQILSFTRDIKNHFDDKGRANIMEMLWGVVFADGEEDNYESNLMRRISGLLYISDKKSGEIRKKVMKNNNIS